MNDKKILFFDIDGTLLTPHPFKVPESTSRALTKAHENGHLLFINTGRTKVMMPSALSELHFDGYIYGCGTHIYMDNKLLFFRTVPNLLCKETVDLLRKCKIEAMNPTLRSCMMAHLQPSPNSESKCEKKFQWSTSRNSIGRMPALTPMTNSWYICCRIPMSKNSAASVMIITPILITETESGKSHKRVPAKPQAWNFSWTAFPSPGKTAMHSETVPTTFPC